MLGVRLYSDQDIRSRYRFCVNQCKRNVKETKSSWDYQVPSWETDNHWKEEKKHKFK